MIIRVFILLLALNVFASVAKAENMAITGITGISQSDVAGQQNKLNKSDCIKRALANLGAGWVNKKIQLSHLSDKQIQRKQLVRNAADLFANPQMGLGWGNHATSVKVTFRF